MPKKSKREKILADIRRRVRTERVVTTPTTVPHTQQTKSYFHFQLSQQPESREAEPSSDRTELSAIKKDLTKTMILAVIAIAAELALYWMSRGKI